MADKNKKGSKGDKAEKKEQHKGDKGGEKKEKGEKAPEKKEKGEEKKEKGDKKEVKGDKKEAMQRRAGVESILLRKFFYVPSFEIHGGVGGLYDWGPPGCAVKQNLLAFWRQHFVLEENMQEVDCVSVTPEIVLKTSGHVDKFTDFMVRDTVTSLPFRADHLLEGHIDGLLENKKAPVSDAKRSELLAIRTKAGAMSQADLHQALQDLKVKSPDGNDVSEPFPFNLMFATEIGPTGKQHGYLRPETAQGIFVNFKRLLEFNGGRMPFACAQVGLAFRNEIAPRAGLLRVREFPLAEIEHFVDPGKKDHPKFQSVADLKVLLLSRKEQTGEDAPILTAIGDAVKRKVINNETLGYYMGRTWLFLTRAGIKPDQLRFRQHKATEMAHYAQDCWDAEVKTTYGWVEVVGHADRAAYDLEVHSKVSKVDLTAYEAYDHPRVTRKTLIKPNKAKIGQEFKGEAKKLMEWLPELEKDEKETKSLMAQLAKGDITITVPTGEKFTLNKNHLEIKEEDVKENGRNYIPAVIEPSFGIGRIIYAILEQSYYARPEEAQPKSAKKKEDTEGVIRAVLQLPPHIAPIKVALLPLSSSDDLIAKTQELVKGFVGLNLPSRLDDSGVGIGKKYARADEIGIPYAITIDFKSLEDNTVTVRERDTTQQIRVPFREVVFIVAQLVTQTITWEEAYDTYPKQAQPPKDADE